MGERLTLERFFWFDEQVRVGKYPNATKLATHFEISTKTAHRSIEFMRDRLGAPLEYDSSRKGFFYTDQSFNLPRLQVSQEELLAILIARTLLTHTAGGIISEDISSFGRKLFTKLGNFGLTEARMNEAFSATWNGYAPTGATTFRNVADALLRERLLGFLYTSPRSGEPVQRLVEPHHLQHYMGSWVLIGFCRGKVDWRKFFLSRMEHTLVKDATFRPRSRKEWRDHLQGAFGIFQGKEKVQVTLSFNSFRARWIREQVWHPDQRVKEKPDGRLELTFPVSDFREVKMKILQFGADVEVVEPVELRQEIFNEIGRMGHVYSADSEIMKD